VEKRINVQDLEPKAYQAVFGMEKYLSTIELDSNLRELIKLRASQINGCAYCIQMHAEDARKNGESETRIYALSAWRESPLFSPMERAVLALTEETTRLSVGGVTKETYADALKHLGENHLAQAIMQIATINVWNRIAVATRIQH